MDIHPSASYIRNFQITRETKGASLQCVVSTKAIPQKHFRANRCTRVQPLNRLVNGAGSRKVNHARPPPFLSNPYFRRTRKIFHLRIIDRRKKERERNRVTSNIRSFGFLHFPTFAILTSCRRARIVN